MVKGKPSDAACSQRDAACSQRITPQQFLKKYSSEPRVIALKRLGVSPINRKGQALKGLQVMNLMKRWVQGSKGGGEDFQAYRYKPARVIAPDPENPHEVLDHTNKMAARDPRIRPVTDEHGTGLYGLFSKSHCWAALNCLVSRSVHEDMDVDKPILVPPPNQPDLTFAEAEGLWCEVVSREGAKLHPEVLEEFMRSENFDAACALAEDEVTLFIDIFDRQHKKVLLNAFYGRLFLVL